MKPIERILSALPDVRKNGSGWSARCPAHDDQRASLSISEGEDGRVLLHCHAGCAPETLCNALGFNLSDLFAAATTSNGHPRIIKTYDYCQADGSLLFQVVRFEPKDFRQRRPDGNGGWIWNLRNTPRVLYRLPELLTAIPDDWVFVVEGEKDADRLAALGMVATTCPQGAGKWSKLSDDSALNGRRVAIVPDKDAAGRRHAADVAARLHGRAREVRILELPGPGKDGSDWFDAGGTVDELLRLVASAPEAAPVTSAANRPVVFIDTVEHRVVAETIAALASDPNLYRRGHILVRVIRDQQPADGILRCPGSPTIQAVPAANLRERMTRVANFMKLNASGEEIAAHPVPWLVSAVSARGEWEGIRHLNGISDSPILRPDGTIWQTPGYDRETGVLFEPPRHSSFPAIPSEISEADVQGAVVLLLEAVSDFPFQGREHQAAWLAALLTPLARFAFAGPTPLFLVDANVRGVGKGLLVQIIGIVVLGREMPVSSYAACSSELCKKITAIAIAGDRLILFDNVEGCLGNDALDRALTSSSWKDRLLGKNEQVSLPLNPAWYATGNNVQVAADTLRRIVHIRMDCLHERPEERAGFRYPNLLEWVSANRGRLLAAALTILSAHLRRGCPSVQLTPFGSFEGWSSVVRQAVVWAGLPDPCLTRVALAASADVGGGALVQLIAAWERYDTEDKGVVLTEMLNRLYPTQTEHAPNDEASKAMRSALENLVGSRPGQPPTARQLGAKLRHSRRRVVGSKYLDEAAGVYSRNGTIWRLHGAETSCTTEALRVCDSEFERQNGKATCDSATLATLKR